MLFRPGGSGPSEGIASYGGCGGSHGVADEFVVA